MKPSLTKKMIMANNGWLAILEMEFLKAIGIALGAIGTVLMGVREWYKRKWTVEGKWAQRFEGQEEIQRILKDFNLATNITRCALIYCQNGGGVPHIGSEITSSIYAEGNDPNVAPYLKKWQNVKVDYHLNKLLMKLAVEGHVYINNTEELPDGDAKMASLAEGIKAFDLHFVTAVHGQWWYMTVSFTEQYSDSARSPLYHDRLRILIHELKQILHKK